VSDKGDRRDGLGVVIIALVLFAALGVSIGGVLYHLIGKPFALCFLGGWVVWGYFLFLHAPPPPQKVKE
jgi:hypothetical protein